MRALLAIPALLLALAPAASAQLTPAPGSPFLTGAQRATDLATADFNGDGKLDLAVASPGDGAVAVLLGDGAGGFAPASGSPHAVLGDAGSVAVGRLNSDQNLDLVTGNRGIDDTVSVLLGNGSGGFAAAQGSPFTTNGIDAYEVAVGELTGDANSDVAVAGSSNGDIRIMAGVFDGSGQLVSGALPASGANNPSESRLVDLNGDGRLDIVSSHQVQPGRISAIRNNGGGTFQAFDGSPFETGSASHYGLDVADLNGDGRPDAALSVENTVGRVAVLLATGVISAPGFAPSPGSPFETGGRLTRGVAIADLSGDGKPDVVGSHSDPNNPGSVALLGGDGAGGLAPAAGSPFATGSDQHSSVVAADFNGDGVPDVATANAPFPIDGPGSVSVLLSPTPVHPPGDVDPPSVSGVAAKPRRFRLARALTPLSGRARRGTRFLYTLSEPASVTLVVERILPGRRKAGRCVAPRRAPRGRRCKRVRRLVALTRAGGAGANGTRFTGRWRSGGRKRRLRPGPHRVSIAARDLAGNSTARPSRAGFRVVRR